MNISDNACTPVRSKRCGNPRRPPVDVWRGSRSRTISSSPGSNGVLYCISRTGDFFDNIMAERDFGRLKTEPVYHERYASWAEAPGSIFEYLEVFYNRKRRHSSLGHLSPEVFEIARK